MLLPVLSLILAALSADALGISANGNVFAVDTIAGSMTLIGNSGYNVSALARDTGGVFWTVEDSATHKLVQIDPLTGAGNPVASLALAGSVRGMAFDHGGELYLVVAPSGGGACTLEKVDMGTYAVTTVGSTLLPTIEGLCRIPELTPGIEFFGWDVGPGGTNGHGLVGINQNNGLFSDPYPAGGDNSILALALDPTGEFIGVGRNLYRVDRITGVSSQTSGDLGFELVGLEFFDAMTTENGALAIEADGDVLRVNSTSGATRVIGNAGASGFVALGKPSDFTSFYAVRDLGATSEVSKISPVNGARTVIGTIPLDDVRAAGFIIHPLLKLIQDGGPGSSDWIYTYNVVTLALTLDTQIAALQEVEAMSIDVNGNCIVNDSTVGLAQVSTVNGFVTDILPGNNGNTLHTLAHDAFGRLFGTKNELYRVDIATGSLTPIGTYAFDDVVGFDFMAVQEHGDSITYCTAQTNSAGCVPYITTNTSFNVPSVSAGTGFTITCLQVLKNKNGLFFYGINGRQSVPFLGGTLCAVPPLKRSPGQNSGGLATCGGVFTLDFNAYVASGVNPALVAGVVVNGQWWSRDVLAASGSNLSNAIEFELCP